jgi:hypothetical protein
VTTFASNLGEIVWRPAIAPAHLALLTLVLIALAFAAYTQALQRDFTRASLMVAMRIVAVVLLTLLLMGPSYLPPQSSVPTRPRVVVMLDTSASMQTPDVGGKPRIRAAIDHWLTPDKLRRLRDAFDVQLLGFDERVHPLGRLQVPDEELATGPSSRYVEAIGDTLLATPRQTSTNTPAVTHHIVVIGDGHDTDERPLAPLADVARQRRAAVHAITVGSTAQTRDLAVVALPRQEYLLADEPGQLLVRIMQVNAPDAESVVHITPPTGPTRDYPIHFASQPSVTLDIPVQHKAPGTYEYKVRVDPLPGEKVTANNEQSAFIEVAQRRMRVLILEGEPFWDTKFLAQALRSDSRIELTQVTKVSADRTETIVTRADRTAANIPVSPADWAKFDVVVLGRSIENVLTPEAAASLKPYVENGGHIIFARGQPYDPDTIPGRQMAAMIVPVEPVIWSVGLVNNLPLRLTQAGRAAPTFAFNTLGPDAANIVADLPPLSSVRLVKQLKPAAQVLASAGAPPTGDIAAEPSPAIVTMNLGRGRVFAVLGEGLWRWSFLPPDLKKYRGVFDTFWSNTVRWLALGGDFAPGEDVSLRLSRTSVRSSDPLALSVVYKTPPPGFAPKLTLTDPDGGASTVDLAQIPGVENRLQAEVRPTKTGVWTATLDAPPLAPAHQVKRFSVYNVDVERLSVAAMPRNLTALAEQTGGLVLRGDEDGDLAALLQRQTAAALAPPAPQYLWDRGVFLIVLLGWIGVEWIGRRATGWL